MTDTLDHAAAITQIGAAKPDWIVATGYINDLILIRQQMADQKVTAKIITGINGPQTTWLGVAPVASCH